MSKSTPHTEYQSQLEQLIFSLVDIYDFNEQSERRLRRVSRLMRTNADTALDLCSYILETEPTDRDLIDAIRHLRSDALAARERSGCLSMFGPLSRDRSRCAISLKEAYGRMTEDCKVLCEFINPHMLPSLLSSLGEI